MDAEREEIFTMEETAGDSLVNRLHEWGIRRIYVDRKGPPGQGSGSG